MKTYSAQSGYVYQYFYEGHRDYRAGGERRRRVRLHRVVRSQERRTKRRCWSAIRRSARGSRAHGRELSLTERYAVAKIALFQAFDERPDPAQMRDEVRVRNADVEGIIETLGL